MSKAVNRGLDDIIVNDLNDASGVPRQGTEVMLFIM